MARKSSTALAIVIGLVLVGLAARKLKTNRRTFKAWTDAEAEAFAKQISATGVPWDAALLVYASESGLDPQASSGIAWGICQATERTLRGLNWFSSHKTAAEFGKLPVLYQLPWVVRLIESQISMIGFVPKTALELYVANFSPVAAKQRADVIYRQGTVEYDKNRNLDVARKGFIDRADLSRALDRAKQSQAYIETDGQIRRVLAGKAA